MRTSFPPVPKTPSPLVLSPFLRSNPWSDEGALTTPPPVISDASGVYDTLSFCRPIFPSIVGRTYLFCAIRPEVKYHAYTFSTCNFAKNASVVKLQPKKAVAASSPAERKLMEELEQMKVVYGSRGVLLRG